MKFWKKKKASEPFVSMVDSAPKARLTVVTMSHDKINVDDFKSSHIADGFIHFIGESCVSIPIANIRYSEVKWQ